MTAKQTRIVDLDYQENFTEMERKISCVKLGKWKFYDAIMLSVVRLQCDNDPCLIWHKKYADLIGG